MVAVPARRIGREADLYAYGRMLDVVQDPGTSLNKTRNVLHRGRNRLLSLARRLGRQDPAEMDLCQRKWYDADLALLLQMCQAQYILRLRVLERRGVNVAMWTADRESKYLPGSGPDLIRRANRLAAASENGDEVGPHLAELVRVAGIGPFLRWPKRTAKAGYGVR